MAILNFPAGRTAIATREEALNNFYTAERNAGTDPLLANERLHEFARRLDALDSDYERDLDIIRQCIERK